jgi:hypothetical protein
VQKALENRHKKENMQFELKSENRNSSNQDLFEDTIRMYTAIKCIKGEIWMIIS